MANLNNNEEGISTDFKKRDSQRVPQDSGKDTTNPGSAKELHRMSSEALTEAYEQIKTLEKKLSKSESNVNQLQANCKELQDTISKRETYQKGLLTRVNNLTKKLEIAEEELSTLKSKSQDDIKSDKQNSLEVELIETRLLLEEAQRDLDTSKKELTSLTKKYDSLVAQSQQYMSAKDELEGLQKLLNSSNEEVSRLNKLIETERKTSEDKQTRLQSDIVALQEQIKAFENSNNIDEKLLKGLRTDLAKTGAELSDTKKAMEELDALSKSHLEKSTQLESTVKEITAEKEQLLSSIQTLNNSLEEIKLENSQLQSQVSESSSSLNASQLQNQELAEKLNELDKTNKVLLEQIENFKQMAPTAEDTSQLEQLKATITSLTEELKTLREQHSNCIPKERIAELQGTIGSLQLDLQKSNQLNSELEQELNKVRSLLNNKGDEEAMLQERIIQLEKSLAEAEKDKQTLNQLCEKLEGDLEVSNAKAKAFDDLTALYDNVVIEIATTNPQASDEFDRLLGKYIGGKEYLIDLM